jgi:hypothetical protein
MERVFVKLNATCHAVAIQKACMRNSAAVSAFGTSFYRPSLLQTESRKEVMHVKLKGGAFAQAISY